MKTIRPVQYDNGDLLETVLYFRRILPLDRRIDPIESKVVSLPVLQKLAMKFFRIQLLLLWQRSTEKQLPTLSYDGTFKWAVP